MISFKGSHRMNDDTIFEDMKSDLDLLVAELEAAGTRFNGLGKNLSCPYHEDRTPSGSIKQMSDGCYRFKCFSCGVSQDVLDVMAHNRSTTADELMRQIRSDHAPKNGSNHVTAEDNRSVINSEVKKEKHVRRDSMAWPEDAELVTKTEAHARFCRMGEPTYYCFKDESGTVITYEVRIQKADGSKIPRPLSPVPGTDEYVFKNVPSPRPVYNLDIMDEYDQVLVVEGPKDCETLASYGFFATTSLNGAGAAKNSDWSPLKGKDIVILPDNDESGLKYADEVSTLCKDFARSVKQVDPKSYGLGNKADITDFTESLTEQGLSREDIKTEIEWLIKRAQINGDGPEFVSWVYDRSRDDYKPVDTPWPILNYSCFGDSGIEPGSVVLLGGPSGVGKTWINLQMLDHWHKNNVDCRALFLESNKTFYYKRILAHVSGRTDLMTPRAYKGMSKEDIQQMLAPYQEQVQMLLNRITLPSATDITIKGVTKWATDAVKSGADVIMIDPITKADSGKDSFVDHLKLMKDLTALVEEYGSRCMLITHPKAGFKGGDALDKGFAGGQSFVRYASNAMVISKTDGDEEGLLYDLDGDSSEQYWNREMYIAKTRDSNLVTERIAYRFSKQTLHMREMGSITQIT